MPTPEVTFAQFEIVRERSKVVDIPIGKLFRRVYHVPTEHLGMVPTRVDIMPGETPLAGVDGLYQPYVQNVSYGKKPDSGLERVIITFIQAEPG